MLRSGSTWQYNIVLSLLEKRGLAVAGGFVAGEEKLSAFMDDGQARVLKMHAAFQAARDALAAGHARGIYSHRDLRDVAASLMMRNRKRLSWVLDNGYLVAAWNAYQAYSVSPNVLVQDYRVIVREPGKAIRQIASFLDLEPDEGEINRLQGEFGLESQKRKIRNMAGSSMRGKALRKLRRSVGGLLHRTIGKDRTRKLTPLFGRLGVEHVDRKSLLHSEHINSGAIGSYKSVLTNAEREVLERYLRQEVGIPS